MNKITLAKWITTAVVFAPIAIASAADSTVLRSTGASMSANALESSDYTLYQEEDVASGETRTFSSKRPRRVLIWAQCTDNGNHQRSVVLTLPGTDDLTLCEVESTRDGQDAHTSSMLSLQGSQAHSFTIHAESDDTSAKVYFYE